MRTLMAKGAPRGGARRDCNGNVQVASLIGADFCFLLTDVDGLYTANPAVRARPVLHENIRSGEGIRSLERAILLPVALLRA